MAASATSATDHRSAPNFLIVDPRKGRKRDIVKYLVSNDLKSGVNFLDSSEEGVKSGAVVTHRWILLVTIIIRRIFFFMNTPWKYLGYFNDFILNLFSQNCGLVGILNNLLHGSLKIPRRGEDNFLSVIGQLDGRLELYRSRIQSDSIASSSDNADIRADLANTSLMDLCMMASKLAYENEKVVKKVVDDYWKMHFVGFYNCWNDHQKLFNTEVFICCDKPEDANLIVVSFRGTETFNLRDWSTDIDLSWYEIPEIGKLHIGFLEALGLGHRGDATTFQTHLQKKNTGLESQGPVMEWAEKSAYYTVASKLKSLLNDHKNAKFVMTGHSLGGALATLFPCILVIQEETELLDKLLNVYTFGQPRIGDAQLGTFMESHLNSPVTRYFRVVYCNDVIPRVPFDNDTFGFKHFGACLYYDSLYFGQIMEEEPNKNFFGVRQYIMMRVNAMWELLRSSLTSHIYGPDYKENWFCKMVRLMGVVVTPGLAAHGPVDYINSVRLGRERVALMPSLKSVLASCKIVGMIR